MAALAILSEHKRWTILWRRFYVLLLVTSYHIGSRDNRRQSALVTSLGLCVLCYHHIQRDNVFFLTVLFSIRIFSPSYVQVSNPSSSRAVGFFLLISPYTLHVSSSHCIISLSAQGTHPSLIPLVSPSSEALRWIPTFITGDPCAPQYYKTSTIAGVAGLSSSPEMTPPSRSLDGC